MLTITQAEPWRCLPADTSGVVQAPMADRWTRLGRKSSTGATVTTVSLVARFALGLALGVLFGQAVLVPAAITARFHGRQAVLAAEGFEVVRLPRP